MALDVGGPSVGGPSSEDQTGGELTFVHSMSMKSEVWQGGKAQRAAHPSQDGPDASVSGHVALKEDVKCLEMQLFEVAMSEAF